MTQGCRLRGVSRLEFARRWNQGWIGAVVAAMIVGAVGLICRSASADDGDLLQSQIQTGEFGSALATARQISAGPQRDQALAQIAIAQNAAGDQQASIATIGTIDDDQSRTAALNSANTMPVGQGGFGGNGADFDSLIELITSTVAPSSWDSNGGAGSIAPFPGGVYVDAEGVFRPALNEDRSGALAELRRQANFAGSTGMAADVHHPSRMRKVSLTRFERAVQLSLAAGRQPTEAMQMMAGLERIKYVLVYPETHDLVLAGPADDWQTDPEGRIVAKTSNHPIVRLDDLVVVLRYMLSRER